MNLRKLFILPIVLFILVAGGCQNESEQNEVKLEDKESEPEMRLVSLSGTMTETLFALGFGDKIVGVDVTSTYPKAVESIDKLGHVSSIKAEGLISLNPTHVFLEKGTIDQSVLQQLESADISIHELNRDISIDGTKTFLSDVANQLDTTPDENIIKKIDDDLAEVSELSNKPKVLFIYGRGAGSMMVAGDGTPVKKVIELAGGQNAVTGFNDYKPLSSEVVIEANPKYILMFTSSKHSLNGEEGILEIPGVKETEAGKNKSIIFMDGQLLSGFGPRLGEAVLELNKILKD
jgi:iron complex transport system substrate-binding protein